MEDIKKLADAIYREKVLRAREMHPSKKMGWGSELFADSCARMRAGIRAQFSSASGEEIERILRDRLARITQLEEVRLFRAEVPAE